MQNTIITKAVKMKIKLQNVTAIHSLSDIHSLIASSNKTYLDCKTLGVSLVILHWKTVLSILLKC